MTGKSYNLVPEWHLREKMKEAGILRVSEFHRKIKLVDPGSVNFAQFNSLIDKPPARLTLRTIIAMAIVLRCQIGDILGVDPANFVEME